MAGRALSTSSMSCTRQRCPAPRGVSLIELMISIAIGLVIVAALLALYVSVSRNNTELARMNRQIENGRFAIQVLSGDIQHAGFWADYIPPFDDREVTAPANVPDAIPDPCLNPPDWADASLRQHKENLIGIPLQHSAGACTITHRVAGTDLIVVRHAAPTLGLGCPAGDVCFQASRCNTEIAAGKRYVLAKSDFKLTITTTVRADLPACTAELARIRPVMSTLYYVRTYAVTPGDRIPTLMRSAFANGTQLAAQPLIEGIESLRVEYGIDDLSAAGIPVNYGVINPLRGDGVPDRFMVCPAAAACTAADLANTVAVRLHVLARSIEPTPGYTDTKTYTLAGDTLAPGGNFRRHVFTRTVRLVNPVGRREGQ